jgi:hypothetical protein
LTVPEAAAAAAGIFLISGFLTPIAAGTIVVAETWLFFSLALAEHSEPWIRILLAVLSVSLGYARPRRMVGGCPPFWKKGLRNFPVKASPLVSLPRKVVQNGRIRSWKTPLGRQGIIPSQKYHTVDFVRVEWLGQDVVGAQVEDFRPECGVGQARSNDEAGA